MSEKDVCCPLCKGANCDLILQGISDSSSTNVWHCQSCSVQFLDPFMTLEDETSYYENYYKSQLTRHNSSKSLSDIQSESLGYYQEYLSEYIELFFSVDEVLEIGCGSGGLIKFLKDTIFCQKVFGCERSETNLKFLRSQFPEYQFAREFSAFTKNKFSIVVGIAVLEHIREPIQFLKSIKHFLKTDGRIVLEMPNQRDPLVSIYEVPEYVEFNYQKQHYYTYSETTLGFLATQAGFKIDDFYYHQQYGLDNHISWLQNGCPGDYSAFSAIFSESTLRSYKKDLIASRNTDVIGVVLKNA